MKKSFRPYIAFLLMGSLLTFSACKDEEDPEPDHEHDAVTTVTLTLTPTSGGQAVTATWEDHDGPGGNAPEIDELVLSANTTYTGSITFASEEEHGDHHDTHDLTEEIREEGTAHEIFYLVTPQGLVTFNKTDKDANNLPIGLETTATTSAAGTGKVRIILKHQPGTKTSTSNENTGESDVDITFDTRVQ
ncbi:hypothetical protein [Pontibacter virosus]|uniref:Type 1 periplasmic binding fold superfamily protein n=1 Tax=Pontibacter virosus TaxID=1765052 RepID=A0A2U1AU62_9BACT|nr:hypothetical protein [Pontibacter virosus]PVY39932.1 hypothetical protein C8E01_10976 [Pontibacter virosus]